MRNNDHTFVVCAYKDSPFLEECILSLLHQSIKTKIILYTSTPSDYIRNICKKFSIPMFIGTGGSIGKDWNNALSFVDTKYATIAHQDDVYQERYLERVHKNFLKSKNNLIVYTNYREWKNGTIIRLNANLKIKKIMLLTLSMFPSSNFWRKGILAFGNPICCPAVSYNMEILSDFRFNETMKVSLDWLAWYEISKYSGRFSYISEELVLHRIHENSETTNTISDNTRTKEDIYMFYKFWPKKIADLIMKVYIKSQNTNE